MPITNIPTHEDYHIKATELIYDAFNELYNENLEKSLASLYHSSELYLKSLICKESPYILINIHKSGLPQNGEKDFSDFYSMDAVDLPKMVTFLHGEDILENIYDKKFKDIYDKIRKIRNKYIHSSKSIDYCEKELLLDLLIVFNTFNKDKEFLSYFSEGLYNWGEYKKEKKDVTEKYYIKIFEQCKKGKELNSFSQFIFQNLDVKYKKTFYQLPKNYRNNDRRYACYKCTNNNRVIPIFLGKKRTMECSNYWQVGFSSTAAEQLQFNSLIRKENNNFCCLTCKTTYILKEYKKCECCFHYQTKKETKAKPFTLCGASHA